MQRTPLLSGTGWLVFLAAALVAVVLIPVLATVPAPGSMFRMPAYLVPLFGKYLCYAILALALDLIWGYAGILSLGQGAFFALGGYCMGMYLMRQIGNVSPNLGTIYIIDSFMVVVFGGVGSLVGTLAGAMGLGIVNKFLEPFAGAVLGKILVLVAIIIFIQFRPRGLFALKGRSVEA